MKRSELKAYLDELVDRYNRPSFIEADPVSIPHRYSNLQDIEISGYLTATIAWGQRATILKNAQNLMERMGHEPHQFVMHATDKELDDIHFVHRTFNSEDLQFIIKGLRSIYLKNKSLEKIFLPLDNEVNTFGGIQRFRDELIGNRMAGRSGKHIANPAKDTAAKRINMFLRWMVRADQRGVDFGLWHNYPMSKLSCPLDVHTGNTARALGLLARKLNDRKAVEELDANLRMLDPIDPVKYDFALFGVGVDPLLNLGDH